MCHLFLKQWGVLNTLLVGFVCIWNSILLLIVAAYRAEQYDEVLKYHNG